MDEQRLAVSDEAWARLEPLIKNVSFNVDLHRFCSGLLRAILAIKEIGYGIDT